MARKAPRPAIQAGMLVLCMITMARGFSFPAPAGLAVSTGRPRDRDWARREAPLPLASQARPIAWLPTLSARHPGAGAWAAGLRLGRSARQWGDPLATQAERRGGSGMRR
jgi:hypothetical protein